MNINQVHTYNESLNLQFSDFYEQVISLKPIYKIIVRLNSKTDAIFMVSYNRPNLNTVFGTSYLDREYIFFFSFQSTNRILVLR